ncbi:uncharacterized protein Z518_03905 [Rhinocladiella mackenziei CBS 650.93]|uniref:acylphosphatase n=1 Tax=Rhinocladiella mackenziei CBS 650.93 TaxID=1442369 RepID=A0A0D2IS19_9EURO|nr:uncharacterized protein Z518_03905 [Rhinocladiella mackenziei CBS 650.93]KIX05931.1 hypothetical protein Z518_03905 [Rhinocladiella mackenziei CBS 650.93]
MTKRIAFTVHGRVQGVCFRDFTQKKARRYGVTGYVVNTSDGKVKGEAQGDADALKKLTADLNEGPRAAHVVKLEIKNIETKEGEGSFSVKV